MISNEQKMEYVEQMIEGFCVSEEFREAVCWLVEEMDKVYDKCLKRALEEYAR